MRTRHDCRLLRKMAFSKGVITSGIALAGTVLFYYIAVESGVSQSEYIAFNASYGLVMGAFASVADVARAAAETAGIADEIRSMPMGMHTMIGEGDGGISGGQKQKILIARAAAGSPRIMIFDEAVSALDERSEKHIAEALDRTNCTRIVIAHRVSTIRNCDRILMMDGGKIVEEGTYEELIDRKGQFAKLAALKMR